MPEPSQEKNQLATTPNSGVTAIIVQKIAPEKTDAFVVWQHEAEAAAAKFEGYKSTDVFPPVEGVQDEWVTIVHFNNNESLEGWLRSDERARLTERLQSEFGEYDLRKVASGLSFWFAPNAAGKPPPGWKMCLTVLLALYPSVVLVNLLLIPAMAGLPLAVKLLLGNCVTVTLLNYVIMPFLRRNLAWWHQPAPGSEPACTTRGAVIVVSSILAIALVSAMLLHGH